MNRIVLAFLALLSCAALSAQSTAPYNPDANDDSYIGAPDLLSTLVLYGEQVGIDSSLTCDYDGTPFEELIGQVFESNVVIDSVLMQYHCFSTMEVFFPSCPESYPDTVSYERAFMLHPISSPTNERIFVSYPLGYLRRLSFQFSEANGAFSWTMYDYEIDGFGYDDFFGHHASSATNSEFGLDWYLPFTEEYDYSELGLSFHTWNGFLNSATYCTILPYWHYVE